MSVARDFRCTWVNSRGRWWLCPFFIVDPTSDPSKYRVLLVLLVSALSFQ